MPETARRWDVLRRLLALSDVSRERFPDTVVYWRARAMRLLALFGLVVDGAQVPIYLVSRAPASRIASILGAFGTTWLIFWVVSLGPRAMRAMGLVMVPLWLTLMAFACYQGDGLVDAGDFAGISAVVIGGMLLGVPGLLAATAANTLITLVIAGLMARGRLPNTQVHLPPESITVLTGTNVTTVMLIGMVLAGANWLLRRLVALRKLADERAAQLSELDAAKTVFLQNMSHEFRQPITLALAPIEDRLQTDQDPPDLRRAHLMVRRNLRRLLRMVGALLDFTAVQAGGMAISRAPQDLPALTRALAGEFAGAVEAAGLRLQIDCPPMDQPVWVDRRMWETIVMNLLSNALKFTMRGEIAVSLRQVGDEVELRVRDTGCGIAKEDQPKLFQRFRRFHASEARSHEGSGIGLALVADLVKMHQGWVDMESEPGRGATFLVRLPRRPAPDAADAAAPEKRLPRAEAVTPAAYVDEAMSWVSTPSAGLPTLPEEAPTPEPQDRRPPASGRPAAQPEPQDRRPPASGRPAAQPEPRDRRTPGQGRPAAQPEPQDPRPLVLVADDSADMRRFLIEQLGRRWRVRAVPDGQAALDVIEEELPDLVLSDVMMPRLDGIALVRELRRRPRTAGLPIILVSARAGHEAAIEGLDAQADDYITKPFWLPELLARVRVHLELHLARRDAAARQDRVVKVLVHELRGPLAVIKGSTDLAIDRLTRQGDGSKDLLRHASRGIVRMDRLLGELADAARAQAGGLVLKLAPFDLAELCTEVAEEQELAAQRSVRLEVPQAPVLVEADRERVRQVLANLIGNAFKYDFSHEPVQLSLRAEGEEAVVAVRDRGMGIPEEDLERVFEANYRTPEAERVARGIGLGLFLCRHIVERHGGRIFARREDVGTSFIFTLPLRGGDGPPPAEGAAAP